MTEPAPRPDIHVVPLVAWMAIVVAIAASLGALAGSVHGLIVAILLILAGTLAASAYYGRRWLRFVSSLLASLLAIGAIVIAAMPTSSSEAKLQLEKFAVQDPSTVDAEIYNVSVPDEPPQAATVDTNTLDVTLRNMGNVAAFIPRAEIKVLFAEQLMSCHGGGGEARASAHYSFKVPVKEPSAGLIIGRDISFQVEAGAVDRLTFSVGPLDQSVSAQVPWLYVVDLRLTYSDSAEPFDVGTAAILARPGDGKKNLVRAFKSGDYDCLAHNADLISRAYEIPATRSSELQALKDEHEALLAPDPELASEACQAQDTNSTALSIDQACFTLTKRSLAARFTFSTPSIPEGTQIMMRIQVRELARQMRWAAVFLQGEWRVGFLENDDPAQDISGTGCGSCTVSQSPGGLEITIATGASLQVTDDQVVSEIVVEIIELQDASEASSPAVLQHANQGLPITVKRS